MLPTSPFEAKPRWPGAPRICRTANLPAFDTLADYAKWEGANCPNTKVIFKWKCSRCGCYHVWSVGGDPAGSSGGTGRSSKLATDAEYENTIRARFGLQLKPT